MKHQLLTLLLFLFSLVGVPMLSCVSGDSAVTVYAAAPQKNKAKKSAKTKQAKKPAAKKATANAKKKSASAKKTKAAFPKAKTASSKAKTASVKTYKSPEQEAADYQEQVAKVERHNAGAAAYMNRDIAHRLGVWGQVGYSTIMPSAFEYQPELPLGFNPQAVGGVGGGAGLGYQLRYKRFLFTTGAEFQMYNSHTRLGNIVREFPIEQYATMHYAYDYQMQDFWQAGYLQIPLIFGMELSDWYWQLGGKIGLNVLGSSRLSGLLTTRISDDELIDDLQNMYAHALVDNWDFNAAKTVQSVRFGLNAALAAEIGLSLDRWLQPKVQNKRKMTDGQRFAQNLHYCVALFAEYGVLNINNVTNIASDAADIPANFTGILQSQPLSTPSDLYTRVDYTSVLSASAARSARLNPLLVGIKVSVFYELPRQEKKMLPMPVEPRPRMAALITNAETGKAIAGAQLSIASKSSDKTVSKASNSKGVVMTRLSKGAYRVTASKLGYLPCEPIDYSLVSDLEDTLRFRLTPEPKPIVYTLCGYALDADSRQPLETEIRIAAGADSTIIYRGSTNDEGLFVSDLLSGQYTINALCLGYMPLLQEVVFTQDTITLLMNRIKEGVKVKINHLYFATNKTVILPESEEALSDLADFLRENPGVSIRITGHTDAVGSDAANMKLSIGRAKAVRADLITRGIDADRIEYDGKGKTEPIATNDTEEGRAQNRRVEFEIISTNGENIQQIY